MKKGTRSPSNSVSTAGQDSTEWMSSDLLPGEKIGLVNATNLEVGDKIYFNGWVMGVTKVTNIAAKLMVEASHINPPTWDTTFGYNEVNRQEKAILPDGVVEVFDGYLFGQRIIDNIADQKD